MRVLRRAVAMEALRRVAMADVVVDAGSARMKGWKSHKYRFD
jgi:hypothetical protein